MRRFFSCLLAATLLSLPAGAQNTSPVPAPFSKERAGPLIPNKSAAEKYAEERAAAFNPDQAIGMKGSMDCDGIIKRMKESCKNKKDCPDSTKVYNDCKEMSALMDEKGKCGNQYKARKEACYGEKPNKDLCLSSKDQYMTCLYNNLSPEMRARSKHP